MSVKEDKSAPEIRDIVSPFNLRRAAGLLSKIEVVRELSQQCSRFAFPKSSLKLDLHFADLASRFDIFSDGELLIAPPLPANWQLFAHYLYEKKLISHPDFFAPVTRNDLPKIHTIAISTPHDFVDIDDHSMVRRGTGYSLHSVDEAMSKAVGELLERHITTMTPTGGTVVASYAELRAKHNAHPLNIFDLNGFLPWQQKKFPLYKRSLDSRIVWARGEEILSGNASYIPAQCIFLRKLPQSEEQQVFFAQPTSNGAAGHFSRDEAIVAALLEAIERDGFLIYWLNKISPKRIDPSTIGDTKVLELLARLRRYGLEYHMLDTTTDLNTPSCTAVIIDRRGKEPTISIGGRAGFSIQDVLLSALTEAHIVCQGQIHDERYVLPPDYLPFESRAIGREERIRIWRGHDMLEHFQFFIEGPFETVEAFIGETWQYQTLEQQFAYLRERFCEKGNGYEIYVYEFKDQILTDLGYHVVKTVVPKLIPMYLKEHMATLDATRLQSVPSALGYTPAEVLNPFPHPFP